MAVAAPLIVTAEFSQDDFAWLEGLRRAHYPADRNQVPAHLTMFHALPPSALDEAKRQLSLIARQPPPRASIAGLMDLGGGVAFRIVSDDLDAIRTEIAVHFHGMLCAQDAVGWRPHITIQNNVRDAEAGATLRSIAELRTPQIRALGLHLWRYRDGPWEHTTLYPFRG